MITVDSLCLAIREFVAWVAEHPGEPVDTNGLVLSGIPGDDTMREVFEAFGGTIRITVKEIPQALAMSQPQEQVIWKPE